MLRLVWLLTLAAMALPAAVIRGNIVENRTGKALSRVVVTLQPIAGTPGNAATLRTDRFGGFEFGSLAAGSYVLKAAQKGFLPLEYGQKLWNSAGQPIAVAGVEASLFLNLRMLRYGGITGSILDENDIGMWGHDVVAYRNSQPPQLTTRATSDDRGVYRISGLEPGVYLVRTAGSQDEQISYIPTFSKESQEFANARIVQVFPDEDSTGMDIRPAPGKLLTISGEVDIDLDYCPTDLTLTLASEMGRKTLDGRCAFNFGSLPPGPYEIYVDAPSVSKSGYTDIALAKDASVKVIVRDTPSTFFQFSPFRVNTSDIQVWARRKDYAGLGTAMQLRLVNNRAILARGRWEVMLVPPQGYYVSGFSGGGYRRSINNRPDGWNEFTSGQSVFFSLSGGPSEMHGIVKSYGEPSVGAPVFLEGWDPDNHKRVIDLRMVRTDIHGAYRFQGLPPGTYRALATFEYTNPDVAAMDLAAAQSIRIEPHGDLQMDLDLYGIR